MRCSFGQGLLLLTLLVSSACMAQSGHYEKAIEAFQKEQVEEAYIHIKNELKENPQYLPALILLAEILIEQRKFELAERELGRAIRLGVDNDIVVKLLGEVLLAQSKFREVLIYADSFSLSSKGEVSYQLVRAKAYRALSKPEDAGRIYQSLLLKEPELVEAKLGLAAIYLAQEKYSEAEMLLASAKAASDGESEYWILQGRLKESQGESLAAITSYQKAVSVEPNSIPALKALAIAYYVTQGNYSKAELIIDQLLELSPLDPHAKLLKSNVLTGLDQNEAAAQILIELHDQLSKVDVQFLAKNSLILFVDSVTSYKLKKWEEASRKLKLYLTKERDVNAAVLLADTYIQLNEEFSALEVLEDYKSELKEVKEGALILVSLYQNFSKLFDASDYLMDLKALYPGDADVLVFSAKNYSLVGEHGKALAELEQATEPKGAAYLYALAITQLNLNLPEAALETLNQLLISEPDNRDYQLLNVQILSRLKRTQQASDLIAALYQQHPDDQKVAYAYGKFLNIHDGAALAQPVLERLTEEFPQNNDYWFLLADIQLNLGQADQAIEILKSKVKGERVETSVQLAQIYCQLNRYSECLAAVNSVLFNDRLNEKALTIKAKAHIAQNEKEEAAQVLSALSNLWSEQPLKLLEVSKLQLANENLTAAEKNLTLAIELNPEIPPLYFELVRLKTRLNKLNEAKRLLVEYEKRVLANPFVDILKGDLSLAEKETKAAFNHYRNALDKDSQNGVAFMKLTQLSLGSSLEADYFAYAEVILEKSQELHFIRHKLADAYLQRDKLEKAKYHLQQLLTKSIPKLQRARALNNLAYLHIKQGRFELATQFSEQALAHYPQAANFLDTHGWALTLSGEPAKGLAFLREAYVRDSSNSEIKFHLAYALAKLNRLSESKQMLEQLPGFPTGIEESVYAQELVKLLS